MCTAAAQVLHEEGFLYDSTLMETLQYSLSNGAGQRVWPCECWLVLS